MSGVLVVDVGTSGVRAGVVRPDGAVDSVHHVPVLPSSPAPGFVEFDAAAMAGAVLAVAERALADGGPVDGVGIANQRGSTVVWDRADGVPVGPGIGWQDLRTVGTCLVLRDQGIRVAPNESATKLAMLLDMADPERGRDLCFGTVDTWVAWTLSGGTVHVTDATNAGITGLRTADGSGWDDAILEALRVPRGALPAVVDSSGAVGEARALPGAPVICGIAGDQQASLVGQGCTRPGLAKATFGTGGMLDLCVGATRPGFARRGGAGTFPIVAWQRAGTPTWGVEAVMLSAGTAVEWLRDDLGIIEDAADSHGVAAACDDTGDVFFVPALLGLGAPVWDFGARGTFVGITRGTGRPEMVRAVLEGVAHRGADLLEAAEADTAMAIGTLRVDGGMTANPTFLSALADALGRPVEVSPVTEATTLGAAYLAGMALGMWADEDELAGTWKPSTVVEPRSTDRARATVRARWLAARQRAENTVPELTAVEF
ncbi:MAG TPA: FGGY-family carbohydrate kinase [Acidimicrobiales bacterium]|nr:FGGY-family carbohydrate kinase [Acidimicrobiales bacterium]